MFHKSKQTHTKTQCEVFKGLKETGILRAPNDEGTLGDESRNGFLGCLKESLLAVETKARFFERGLM